VDVGVEQVELPDAITTPAASSATPGWAWIDGAYTPVAEARIPILDTGFVRSDATYDVVAVWKGKFFRLDDHLDRLQRGCEKLRLRLALTRADMREILIEVVRRSGLRDAYVEGIASRGVPAPDSRDPRRCIPRFYAYAIPYVWIVPPEQQDRGTSVVVAHDTLRTPPGAFDPTVKNFQWGDFMRALFEAYDRDSQLPLLTDGDGKVTEGPGFNIFAVVNGVLHTPARGVLQGITRRTVLEIAAELDLPAETDDVPVSALYGASELFLTSTAGGVMPVALLDGLRVGSTCPGPITRQIRARYWHWHDDSRFTTAIDYKPVSPE
jgi:branched-subunit amino acid aminotransferase/4-amino-4-deoxychorismate lyase